MAALHAGTIELTADGLFVRVNGAATWELTWTTPPRQVGSVAQGAPDFLHAN